MAIYHKAIFGDRYAVIKVSSSGEYTVVAVYLLEQHAIDIVAAFNNGGTVVL